MNRIVTALKIIELFTLFFKHHLLEIFIEITHAKCVLKRQSVQVVYKKHNQENFKVKNLLKNSANLLHKHKYILNYTSMIDILNMSKY